MADLLFSHLCRRWRERRFRAGTQCEINDFTDEELRAHYRFRWESILFITNLVAGDVSRNTRRNHALSLLHQVLIALRFYTSGSFLQIIGDTFGVDKSTISRVIDLLRLYILFSQYRSCDDTQEIWSFVLFIKKSIFMLACTLFNEQDKGSNLLSIITWSVLGKQNVQAKKVY